MIQPEQQVVWQRGLGSFTLGESRPAFAVRYVEEQKISSSQFAAKRDSSLVDRLAESDCSDPLGMTNCELLKIRHAGQDLNTWLEKVAEFDEGPHDVDPHGSRVLREAAPADEALDHPSL